MANKDLLAYTKELLELFESSNLTTMEYEDEHVSVKFGNGVTSSQNIVPLQEVSVQKQEEIIEEKKDFKAEVLSPIVGTFYTSPSPEQAAYVSVGDVIKEGQVLCIVEAMKVMNEITAPCSGTVSEILVEDKDGVEFNQVLFRIQ